MTGGWSSELTVAAVALLIGVLLPVMIFYAGASLLGRYEGASLGHLYGNLISGLASGSLASWIVLLGPYALYLVFKGLRACWRVSENLG